MSILRILSSIKSEYQILANKSAEVLRWGRKGYHGRSRIGNRQIVGFGTNGSATYKDDVHFPFPAIRFMEENGSITALHALEKCDWKLLPKRHKKALYRASFCQTFREFQHPTGLWKLVLGGALFVIGCAFWINMFFHFFVFEPLPPSLSKMRQEKQLWRMLELHVNPIDGLSSRWNGERWKILLKRYKSFKEGYRNRRTAHGD